MTVAAATAAFSAVASGMLALTGIVFSLAFVMVQFSSSAYSPRLVLWLSRAVELKRERTFEQDPKYALRLLADIAIKALSPAIYDPTTAVQALDHIEDLLRRLGQRHLEVGQVRDKCGALRVIFPTPIWKTF
jgi:uncharacterized membrane protein